MDFHMWFLRYVFTLLFSHSHMQPQYFNTCIAPCPKVYQQGVLHVRYLVFVCMLLVTHCFYAPLFSFFVVFCLLISRIIVLFSLLFAS